MLCFALVSLGVVIALNFFNLPRFLAKQYLSSANTRVKFLDLEDIEVVSSLLSIEHAMFV